MFHTVAAISTPPGKGGVALIRISGEDAAAVADRIFTPAAGVPLSALPPRRAVYGVIHTPAGERLDSGIATLYRAPASFTGEDVAEISCHGGTAVTRAVLSAALAAGAEGAEPGDFTRRAFANGKITLSEAEAIGLLIDADTDSRRALAANAAGGALRRALKQPADALTEVLSALYAAIDYPEEDVGDEGERRIASVIAESADAVDRLLATYRTGAAIANGIPAVIAGVPNSGKSSLYNALLRREDAIVTELPGTTRDVLSAEADVGGVTLRLFDTAGIREGADAVEQIGVSRAREKIRQASLILFVADQSAPLSEECRALIREIRELSPAAHLIAVLNKSDLPAGLTESDRALIGQYSDEAVTLCAKTGEGTDNLAAAVARFAGTDVLDAGTDAILWDARQSASLTRASALLREARAALADGDPTDAVCTLCEAALSEITGVDGRAVDEAIIAGIFARFCVGK